MTRPTTAQRACGHCHPLPIPDQPSLALPSNDVNWDAEETF